MPTIVDAIPHELRRLDRWLCCDTGSKRPIRPSDGRAASVTRSADWGSFADASSLVESGFCEYLGFVFAEDGYVGIDIDHAFCDDGTLSTEATEIIRACKSYTEVSKSGSGIHIVCRGDIPFKGRNNRSGWEIYKGGRWFVLTGRALGGWSVAYAQEGIDLALERHFSDYLNTSERGGDANRERIWRPVWPEIVGNRIPVEPVYPTVSSGARHISLVSFCGQMWHSGVSAKQLYASAQAVNQKYLQPPLEDKEVQQIASSVTRYRR